MFLPKYLLLCVVFNFVRPEKLPYEYSPGYQKFWNEPRYLKIDSRNGGSTSTVCVFVSQDIGIELKNGEKNVYSLRIRDFAPLYTITCFTFAWKSSGITLFHNGKYQNYIEDSNLRYINEVLVNATGTYRMDFLENSPSWALSESYAWGSIPIVTPIPARLQLNRNITIGDYIIIVIDKPASSAMNIKLEETGVKVPVSFKWRSDMYKYEASMTSIEGDHVHTMHSFSDSLDFVNTTERMNFSVIFSCERLGWRVYLNGMEIFFYYHQLLFDSIDRVVLSGDASEEWVLVHAIHGPGLKADQKLVPFNL